MSTNTIPQKQTDSLRAVTKDQAITCTKKHRPAGPGGAGANCSNARVLLVKPTGLLHGGKYRYSGRIDKEGAIAQVDLGAAQVYKAGFINRAAKIDAKLAAVHHE